MAEPVPSIAPAPGGAPLLADSLDGAPLVYANAPGQPFAYAPEEFAVRLDEAALARLYAPVTRPQLIVPPGWEVRADEAGPGWQVRPRGRPPGCLVNLRLLVAGAAGPGEVILGVPIELRGRSQFEPERHALPFANTAAELGETAPSRDAFAATYRRAPLGDRFYGGLYSAVVFLSSDAMRPGGLCTGIARTALELSLRQGAGATGHRDGAELRRTIAIWHGRQLADRALLASTWAWLTRGSRDAYLAFRDDLLAGGRSSLAFDINVPRPWRRDLLTAFVGNGHTVVPYGFTQVEDDRAEVQVYDPNYPRPEEMPASVIAFDLAADSYRYRHLDGGTPGRPSKVLAVRQEAYRAADTAFLAGLASAALVLGAGLLAGLAPLTRRLRRPRPQPVPR